MFRPNSIAYGGPFWNNFATILKLLSDQSVGYGDGSVVNFIH